MFCEPRGAVFSCEEYRGGILVARARTNERNFLGFFQVERRGRIFLKLWGIVNTLIVYAADFFLLLCMPKSWSYNGRMSSTSKIEKLDDLHDSARQDILEQIC